MAKRQSQFQNLGMWIAAGILILVLGAFLFAASGIYNVAASRGHLAAIRWFLDFGMRRSVATHSIGIAHPLLNDPDLVQLGAAHYQGGCAPCHGAPGAASNPIVQHMLPSPPDLAKAVRSFTPQQLFWVAKHGLKYTGMPAWVASGRDDEVWAIVAFLVALPDMESEQYRRLVEGNAEPLRRNGRELAQFGKGTEAISRCVRCHGDETHGSVNALVPKLRGQSLAYLELSLRDYAEGLRQSGIMQPIAATLDKEAVAALAQYYAHLPAEQGGPFKVAGSEERLKRGTEIASKGIVESGVPPCLACHGGKSAPTFPKLAGQHARYLAGQLRLWKRGLRERTAQGAIMGAIAPHLTEQQIGDVAAYFENLRTETLQKSAANDQIGALP